MFHPLDRGRPRYPSGLVAPSSHKSHHGIGFHFRAEHSAHIWQDSLAMGTEMIWKTYSPTGHHAPKLAPAYICSRVVAHVPCANYNHDWMDDETQQDWLDDRHRGGTLRLRAPAVRRHAHVNQSSINQSTDRPDPGPSMDRSFACRLSKLDEFVRWLTRGQLITNIRLLRDDIDFGDVTCSPLCPPRGRQSRIDLIHIIIRWRSNSQCVARFISISLHQTSN